MLERKSKNPPKKYLKNKKEEVFAQFNQDSRKAYKRSWAQFGEGGGRGGAGEGGLERVGVGKGQKRGEDDII